MARGEENTFSGLPPTLVSMPTREREKRELQKQFIDLFREARDMDEAEVAEKQNALRKQIGEDNYARMNSIIAGWFANEQGGGRGMRTKGIVFAMSLFLRLQNDPSRFGAITIANSRSNEGKGKKDHTILNIFRNLFSATSDSQKGFIDERILPYEERIIFTRGTNDIKGVGKLKGPNSLQEIHKADREHEYGWVYEMHRDHYKKDLELTRATLLLLLHQLYLQAEKDRKRKDEVKRQEKKRKESLATADTRKVLSRLVHDSSTKLTGGQRAEGIVAILEKMESEKRKGLSFSRSKINSYDKKFPADIYFQEKQTGQLIDHHVEVKDDDFSLKGLRDSLDKMCNFHGEKGVGESKGLFIYCGSNGVEESEIESTIDSVLSKHSLSRTDLEIDVLSFDDYLKRRLFQLNEAESFRIESEVAELEIQERSSFGFDLFRNLCRQVRN